MQEDYGDSGHRGGCNALDPKVVGSGQGTTKKILYSNGRGSMGLSFISIVIVLLIFLLLKNVCRD